MSDIHTYRGAGGIEEIVRYHSKTSRIGGAFIKAFFTALDKEFRVNRIIPDVLETTKDILSPTCSFFTSKLYLKDINKALTFRYSVFQTGNWSDHVLIDMLIIDTGDSSEKSTRAIVSSKISLEGSVKDLINKVKPI